MKLINHQCNNVMMSMICKSKVKLQRSISFVADNIVKMSRNNVSRVIEWLPGFPCLRPIILL